MELDFVSQIRGYQRYKAIYETLIGKTLKTLRLKIDPIVSVTFVDDEFIHNLNLEYRKINRATDVISFAFIDGEDKDTLFKSKNPLPLGDIYISIDRAKAQAKEFGHPLERELSFLFVHGLLHLLGYDHMTKEDETIMFGLQDKILPPKGEQK